MTHASSVPEHSAHAGKTAPSAPLDPPVKGDATWKVAQATVTTDAEAVCRWDFSEAPGRPRWSSGRERYPLYEMAGPVARGDDGPGGGATLDLKEGQWLRCPRAECPALDFRGPATRFSVVAWVRRRAKSTSECEAVAGMWNETHRTRQYCLFLNLRIWDSVDQACGHLSSTGAPSPGYRFCMEAAIGATRVEHERWHLVAFTYDGHWGRIYVDGRLDYRPGLNPYHWPLPITDGGSTGSDFTVGAVFRGGQMGNWFSGSLGGLAIYDACLTEADMARRWQEKTV